MEIGEDNGEVFEGTGEIDGQVVEEAEGVESGGRVLT